MKPDEGPHTEGCCGIEVRIRRIRSFALPYLTIVCPSCGALVPLTESLAAPMLDEVRKDYDTKLAKQNAEVAKREAAASREGHARRPRERSGSTA